MDGKFWISTFCMEIEVRNNFLISIQYYTNFNLFLEINGETIGIFDFMNYISNFLPIITFIRSNEGFAKTGNEILLSGSQDNMCGISTLAFVPVLA